MSSNSGQDDPTTTNNDRDCSDLARAALFPLKIGRDGTHRTLFPAVEALDKIRDDLIAQYPNNAASSFFPRRVVLVRSVAGNYSHNGQWQWNGQPDLQDEDASLEVIPQRLSIKCMECAPFQSLLPQAQAAFIRDTNKPYYGAENNTIKEKEIILCTDRLLKKDFNPDQMRDFNKPSPKSLKAVEEVLAREITKVRDQMRCTASCSSSTTPCQDVAATEIRAARAAECYFQKQGKEVQKGSRLPLGYSLLPSSMQRSFQHRCIRAVASNAAAHHPACRNSDTSTNGQGKQCVNTVFENAMNSS